MESKCLLCGRDESVVVKDSGSSMIVRCKWCGVAYRNPDIYDDLMLLRVPEKREKRPDYSQGFHSGQKYFNRYILRKAARVRRPPGKFLDVGCGFGDMLQTAKEEGWDAWGVDVSEDGVNICRENGLNALHGTIGGLALEDDSFDAATIRIVLEYMKDPVAELEQIRRVLKPGGVLIARTLNLGFHLTAHNIYESLKFALAKFGVKDPSTFHRHSFSTRGMKDLVEKAGFMVVEAGPSPMVRGDPYSYAEKPLLKKLLSMYTVVNDLSGFAAYYLSGKRWVITPSALTICKKTTISRKPRVLHIITRMDQGGSAVNTIYQIKETAGKYDNSLICGSLEDMSEAEVNELKGVCDVFVIEPSLRRNPHPMYDALAILRLRGHIRRGSYDIVATHTSKAGFTGRIAARLARAPIVIHHTHGHVFSGYFGPAKSKLFEVLERFAAIISDRVVCLTDIEIEDHLKLNIGRRALFRSLPSGVAVEKYSQPRTGRDEVRKSLGIPACAPLLAVVARMEPVKGVRHAIEALAELKGLDPQPHLVICGEGAERSALEKLSEELGVAHLVHAPGQRRDVPDILHASDVFLLPSLYEGYGRVIVEAMCAGLPVVSTNTSGAATLVKDGVTGFLTRIGDAAEMAAAVKRLISDEELAARMSDAAKKTVSEELSARAAGLRLEGFYEELIRSRDLQE